VAVTFQNCLVAATAQFPVPSRPLFTKKEESLDVNNKCSSYGKERLTINPISKQDKPQSTRPFKKQKEYCKLFWPNENKKKRQNKENKKTQPLNLKKIPRPVHLKIKICILFRVTHGPSDRS
jgi:hypothetical protein